MGNAIFISYRRDDTEGEAGRLFDDLTRAFGPENVFMDVAGIRPGVDFRTAIEDNVAHCGVLLAIVGPTWVTIANATGERRLDDPNDFVALEIASALKREVPVIPVLVHNAQMPSPGQLPASLESFSYRNSVELTHARWNSDVKLLIEALKAYITPTQSVDEPVHATVPVQLPAPHPPATAAQRESSRVLIFGVAVVVLLAIAIGLYFFLRPEPAPAPVPATTTTATTAAAATLSGSPALVGTWKEPDHRQGNSLGLLVISGSGSSLTMRAFGMCQTASCDWGKQPATIDGQNATATFTPPDTTGKPDATRAAVVSVHMTGSNLDVTVENTFNDASGSHKNQVHRTFVSAQ